MPATPPAVPRLPLLLVASWYPSRDDPIAGRFVADQAAALQAAGRVTPAVVSFDPATLIGSGPLRTRMADTVGTMAAAAVTSAPDVFHPSTATAPGVPVARLAIASGRDPAAGALHAVRPRGRALLALAERWSSGGALTVGQLEAVAMPSIVHAHTVYPDGAAAVGLAQRLGRPLVLTEHASFIPRLLASPAIRTRYVAAIDEARRLVVVSRTLADEIVAALPEVAAKVMVIPNAVDVEAFHLPAPGERRPDELLFVGYRKESKGLDTLLVAFARVHAERPDTVLRLIGSAPTPAIEAGWQRRAAELGIGAAVRFEPATDRAGVARAMAQAALFVHPSPRETFGVVAVEALAAGLPVVATDSGGVTEILGPEPARFGALVPAGDPAALAAAISTTLAQRARFDPAELRAWVTTRYGAPAVATRLADLYDEVLAEQPAGTAAGEAATRVASVAPASGDPIRVVVALDPDRAGSLTGLPAAMRSRLIVVTSADPTAATLTGFAGVVLAEIGGRAQAASDAASLGPPGGGVRRLYRIMRHPMALARRRGLLPGLESSLTTRGAAAVREGVAQAGQAGTPQLVCADGVDYLAAQAVVDAGLATLAPGGLAWLGDRAETA